MFKTRLFTGDAAIAAISEALKHRLYISGWRLSHEYCWIRDQLSANRVGYENSAIVVGYRDGVPVAAVLYNSQAHELQAFTRKAERGNGFGGQCLQKMLQYMRSIRDDNPSCGNGIDGSDLFWRSHGLSPHW
jgi:GNAT superfamily N-acetyltransferase